MASMVRKSLVLFFVIVCSVSLAMAADQIRDKDQNRDGSCLLPEDGAAESHGSLILAKDQIRDKDQNRDGSCLLPEDGAVESHGLLIFS